MWKFGREDFSLSVLEYHFENFYTEVGPDHRHCW